MISGPNMTFDEVAEVTQLLVEFWPAPELGERALVMLQQGLLDTGLDAEQCLGAIRELMQGDHAFRPTVGALKAVAKPAAPPAYHRPFAELPEAPPADPETVKSEIARARGVLGADPELARAAKAARDAQREGLAIGPADRYKRLAPALAGLVKGAGE